MWKVTEHRCSSTIMELNVAIIVKEAAEIDWIRTSNQLEDRIKERIQYIPRRNGYQADCLYQVHKTGVQSAEVWKTTPAGDKKYKMFTLSIN